MPRKTSKKQTRLAFAPATDANETASDRYARLSYVHPSLPTMRPERPRESKPSSPHVQASLSTSTTPRKKSPVKESKLETKGMKDREKVMKDEKGQRDKQARKERRKRKEKEPEEEEVQQATQEQENSSEDEIVAPGSLKRARRSAKVEYPNMKPTESTKSPQIPAASSENAISLDISDEEKGDIIQPRRRLKRKAELTSVVLNDSDDSEPVASSPAKRRRRISPSQTPRTPHLSQNQEQQDLEDDVKDLQDSVVKQTRTRGRVYESARDKKLKLLETLRRRRAGEKEESDHDSEGESEDELPQSTPTHHFIKSRHAYEDNGDDSDAESDIDFNEDLDRYEDDFVLEDTELGVPTEEIPFEFTRHAYKQPKEYFRDVVAWMVHNRIDPAFPRDDAMYQMAFQKLGDEVKARAGSSLISSVWTPKFRQVLLARPHLEITSFPTALMHSCDACNRSGHPASSDLKFYGKAYSEETLEPLTDEDESDSSHKETHGDTDDESDVERDRDGNVLPDENTRFYLGKTCRANAYMAHLLTHWRYQLNEWVVDYLTRMGHMEDSEVLRRNNMSQKRKTRNAIEVCKKMEDDGEIERLYRDFHIHLKTAREKTSTMELLQNMG